MDVIEVGRSKETEVIAGGWEEAINYGIVDGEFQILVIFTKSKIPAKCLLRIYCVKPYCTEFSNYFNLLSDSTVLIGQRNN